MSENHREKMEFLNGLVVNSYNQLIEHSRQLDSKTHNIITIVSALLPLVLGLFYYLMRGALTQLALFPYIALLVGLGVVLFILAMVTGCWTYKTLSYRALDSYTFLKRHFSESMEDILEVATVTLGDMTNQNWDLVQQKARWFEHTLRFLTLGAIAFGIGFLLLMLALAFPSLCL
jgi:hypothetical protein